MSRLGVVVGLPTEAICLRRTLRQAPPLIFCAGADPTRVASGVAALVAAGAQMLISFGFAGGLAPSLRPGDIVVADQVASPSGETIAVDHSLRQRICNSLDRNGVRCHVGIVAGVSTIFATAQAKRELARITGAVAADMESHAVAQAAAGLPFAVLRVIIDPADRAIPASVLGALRPDGRVGTGKLIGGLLRRPGELRSLVALAYDNRAATNGLCRAAGALEEAT